MKKFMKKILTKTPKSETDFFDTEIRWTKIYLSNKNSNFYKNIQSEILKIPPKNFVIEYGSSIGIISNTLALRHKHVFGIDTSFSALLEAKNKSPKNCEYLLADVIQNPFGRKKFDFILALNLLELVEPSLLLKNISKQISNGFILLTDPYDYDRGKNSVKSPLNEKQIRNVLSENGFKITMNTKNPAKINWNLQINTRTKLNYKVDLIVGRKNTRI